MERDEQKGADPQQLAGLLAKIIAQPPPRNRYPVGGLSQKLGVAARRILPSALMEKGIRATYKI